MRSLKLYLTVVTTLLLIAIGFGVYVWVLLQELDADTKSGAEGAPELSKDAEGLLGK